MKRGVRNVFIGVFILLFIFKLTGVLSLYKLPSTSNEPNLKLGSRFFGSNLIEPKPLDFAYFKFSDSIDGNTIVKRLIAVPGDKLEFKNGAYYVNHKNVDENLNLRFCYKIDGNSLQKLKQTFNNQESFEFYPLSKDSFITYLDREFVKTFPIKLKRFSFDINENLSKDIFSKNKNWNLNNFGPIIIPKAKYFFSGDNRDNSLDSRYRGFVDEADIKGTVIFKF